LLLRSRPSSRCLETAVRQQLRGLPPRLRTPVRPLALQQQQQRPPRSSIDARRQSLRPP